MLDPEAEMAELRAFHVIVAALLTCTLYSC